MLLHVTECCCWGGDEAEAGESEISSEAKDEGESRCTKRKFFSCLSL